MTPARICSPRPPARRETNPQSAHLTGSLGTACALALLATACSSAPALPAGFARWLDEAPDGMPVRFHTDGDRLVAVSVPTDHRQLPAVLRRVVDAVAPGGTVTYSARELGAMDGWRVEKSYTAEEAGQEGHARSVLLAADGSVLERTHRIPLAEVPEPVLRGALELGRDVTSADVVQARSEWFRLTVVNAFGWHHAVDVDADGTVLRVVRVKSAEVRVAVGS